jgi:peptide chain release factor 2
VTRKLARSEQLVGMVDELERSLEDAAELFELAVAEDDSETTAEIAEELERVSGELDRLEDESLYFGEYDEQAAILSVHAGAGGVDAQDWAEMLFRMYQRYLEDAGFSAEVDEVSDGDEAGIKSATMTVRGDRAYAMLEGERGVHRLVRISPFDSNARRHTSFAGVDVIPEVEDAAVEIDQGTSGSTPTGPRGPAASTSTHPTPRSG